MKNCFECGVAEGEFHEVNCEVEPCAKCGHSYAQCGHEGCGYLRIAWLSVENNNSTMDYKQDDGTWLEIPVQRRVYIYYEEQCRCVHCGKKNPDLLMYSDEVWEHYIEPKHQKDTICPECFTEIQALVDAKVKRPDWCGFLWNPMQFIHKICTLPKGHGGRRHETGRDAFYRHKGRVHNSASFCGDPPSPRTINLCPLVRDELSFLLGAPHDGFPISTTYSREFMYEQFSYLSEEDWKNPWLGGGFRAEELQYLLDYCAEKGIVLEQEPLFRKMIAFKRSGGEAESLLASSLFAAWQTDTKEEKQAAEAPNTLQEETAIPSADGWFTCGSFQEVERRADGLRVFLQDPDEILLDDIHKETVPLRWAVTKSGEWDPHTWEDLESRSLIGAINEADARWPLTTSAKVDQRCGVPEEMKP